jgi:MYXO-CTERM domain-containing protein
VCQPKDATGCGCEASGANNAGSFFWLALVGLALLARRRAMVARE